MNLLYNQWNQLDPCNKLENQGALSKNRYLLYKFIYYRKHDKQKACRKFEKTKHIKTYYYSTLYWILSKCLVYQIALFLGLSF